MSIQWVSRHLICEKTTSILPRL
ncbi:hypothetical protein MTR67_030586 [Solanum verrucosum]|uniref:Uncharacterized protein n=1 Tax=Solanum verrucosum TaxID=315347 RepID=A0AAF0R7W3_SOLVR|nr:hypothetical protein MTR67_030586 [Solanum verrucosum]